ncbi:DUF3313 family protein [Methylomonas sp. LL1]|uniref:DUF3313 family protein n=1 Tax=Methylomonas sp. LL1 TaxID=2785785 RepID=UPI0018C37EA8|nr:DUF3313 family protein [Methylomonas sp. LL1]QPK63566.1 DUF3313 family protein [Methylomonas sp. LL1]
MKNFQFLPVMLSMTLAVVGCGSVRSGTNDIKAKAVEPAPDAGFIQHPELQSKRADLPFQKVWIKPGFDKSGYRELIVAPVNTSYMQQMDWLHSISSANILGDVKKDTEELAQYFRSQIIKKFREDPNHRFSVIDYARQYRYPALQLELALIEIDPSQSVLHAMSWAGPPGTGTAVGVVNQRRAAFEARLRDVQTGEVVATFADRDMQDAGPLDLTRLTWYGPAKGIMDRWAEQFVQIANRKPGEMVTDPLPFTVRPF